VHVPARLREDRGNVAGRALRLRPKQRLATRGGTFQCVTDPQPVHVCRLTPARSAGRRARACTIAFDSVATSSCCITRRSGCSARVPSAALSPTAGDVSSSAPSDTFCQRSFAPSSHEGAGDREDVRPGREAALGDDRLLGTVLRELRQMRGRHSPAPLERERRRTHEVGPQIRQRLDLVVATALENPEPFGIRARR
jgi:hypothetical protein